MELLDIYIEKNKDSEWFKDYAYCAENRYGRIFKFKSTNFRYLKSFFNGVYEFNKCNGLSREEWEVNARYNQIQAKIYTVPMRQSKLFRKKTDSIYEITAKGQAILDICNNNSYNDYEKKIISYFTILDGYFDLCPNYVIKRTDFILDILYKIGFTDNEIEEECLNILKNCKNKLNIFDYKLFWMFSFYHDIKFLNLIRNEFNYKGLSNIADYVRSNLTSGQYKDALSSKYRPQGNYDYNMFMEDVEIVYLTMKLETFIDESSDYIDIYQKILEVVNSYSQEVDFKKIIKFIVDNKDIYEQIYFCLIGKIEEDILKDYFPRQRKSVQEVENIGKIDNTTTKTKTELEAVSSVLKDMAKKRCNYRCELDGFDIESCRYFTDKFENRPYLEVHHFIPREFSNEFVNSIEVIENYVCLCPHCHRLLHHAVDAEKAAAIKRLYDNRIDLLKNKGLIVDLKTIKRYYNFD